jgi:hypothetical protein
MDQLLGKVLAIAFVIEVLTNTVKTLLPDLNRRYLFRPGPQFCCRRKLHGRLQTGW